MVQVDEFKVPMDFVVLETKGALLRNKEYMILLGKSFMATTKMVIDVHSGKLTLMVLVKTVQLIVVDPVPYPFVNFPNQCSYFDCLNLLVSNPSF